MQKQAVLVCSVCALAAILTIAITMTLLKRGKTPAAPGEQPSSEVLVPGEEDISDHYQISETSAALLTALHISTAAETAVLICTCTA